MKWACGLTGVGAGLLLLTLILAANESISQNSNDRCSTILERQAASAAPTSPAAPTTPATPSAPATPAAPTVPNEKDNLGQLRIIETGPEQVQLGSRLCVAVAGVAAKSTTNPPSTVPVTLFLNDQRSPLVAQALAIPDRQVLTYDLAQPTDANSDPAKFWRGIVGGKTHHGAVSLTVGLSRTNSTTPEVSAAPEKQITLIVFRPLILALGGLSLVVLIVAFVMFAANTTILRDNDSKDGGVPVGTFSLGKTQMALWLALVTAGFIFLWLTLGLYLHLITAGILVLLGINGATGLAAVAIDNTSTAKTQGFFADITIFDPATIVDHATYAEPSKLSDGVHYVFVNGQLEYDRGTLTGQKAGRPLRGSRLNSNPEFSFLHQRVQRWRDV